MPYHSRAELPQAVKEHLPPHAQDIYKEAYNSAFDQYKDPSDRKQGGTREQTAHQVAWSAVKSKYTKGSDENWHRK